MCSRFKNFRVHVRRRSCNLEPTSDEEEDGRGGNRRFVQGDSINLLFDLAPA